jgi:hypothetical protein
MRSAFTPIILLAIFLVPDIAFGDESFGRLFTTPAERAKLDFLRKTTNLPVIVPNQPTGVEAPPAVPLPVSVEGYVKRGDGKKGTVWINNAPVQEDSGSGDVGVGKLGRDSNEVQLKLPSINKNLSLKAGQVYDPETDSVSEINAHAKKMAKVEVPDSGTIGTNPGDAAAETNRRQATGNESKP